MQEDKLKNLLLQSFCWFHQHPELPYEEVETTAKIKEILTEAGVEILPLPLETGVVAIVKGQKPGKVQALRCDIDALPIQEETKLPYQSLKPNQMHACGHDFHITVGLGCALMLQNQRETLSGTIKIIFQPAEEESHGALKIIETDVMEDVECIWGIHADPTNGIHTLGIREGYVTAAVDKFLITVKGVGCHGAHPDDGINPILAAAAMIQAFQTIIAQNINAFEPSLLSVTRIEAGNTWNVIPQTAVLEGTVRSLDAQVREQIQQKMQQIITRIAAAYGAEGKMDWTAGPPATYNDGEMVQKVIQTAQRQNLRIVEEEHSMGGDDFAFYEKRIPGCYIKVGTGKGPLIHQPGFQVDTEMLLPTVQFMVELLSH